MDLHDLGWDASFADAFRPHARAGLVPARVAARHHGPCELLTAAGRIGGLPAGRLDGDRLPCVGDWVAARPLPGERKAIIEAVLPRRATLIRKEAWRRAAPQVIAANVDTVLLVTAFGRDLNPRRMERYLAAVWASGAAPAVVVNKLDLAGADDGAMPLRRVAGAAPVLEVSAADGRGMATLRRLLGPGRTSALVGSSGVGKSTLVNRLAGRDLLPTRALSRTGMGRHATAKRQLVPIPGQGVLVDTPGMRELQVWAADIGAAFADVAALAAECRFAELHPPARARLQGAGGDRTR